MLRRLTIKNFALLRDAEIIFEPGFTVVTGETGAGKSLIVESLRMLGGGRTDAAYVRDGARTAVIEGEFIQNDRRVVLRREIAADGRSRVFIDDALAGLRTLGEIAAGLFDITSQRAFSHLLEPSRHLDFLDQYAGLGALRDEMARCEEVFRGLSKRIGDLTERRRAFAARREQIEFQLRQIDEVNPQPGEDELLAAEIRRLEHYEELLQGGERVIALLESGGSAADETLAEAARLLEQLGAIDPELSQLATDLEDARAVVREVARQAAVRYNPHHFDQHRLERLRERQMQINGLARKFGGSLAAALELKDKLTAELTQGDEGAGELERLIAERKDLVKRWSRAAIEAGNRRHQAAGRLAESVRGSLEVLGIKDAVFEIALKRTPESDGLLEADGKRWRLTATGAETAEFFLSANPGMAPKPLIQVASGGELSRLLLAVKEALPVVSDEATVVFDEIDAGVSGRVARLVGLKLRQLADGRQMIAITHLPQIAALADHHLRAAKTIGEVSTETKVQCLAPEERLVEIAAMISGGTPTDAALEQAFNLINSSID